MKSTVLWALIAINAMLATTFVLRLIKPSAAYAQNNRPGDYIIVPAEVVGGNGAIVYVIDTTRGQLSAMGRENNRLASMQPIDLNRVFEARGGNRRAGD